MSALERRMNPIIDRHGSWVLYVFDTVPIPPGRELADNLQVVLMNGPVVVRQFTYPAYKIYTLLAHWTEGLAEVEEDGNADDGHRFSVTVRSAGSYIVVSEEGHHDSDWWSDPREVIVRAWNQADALRIASKLPLAVWFPQEHDEPQEDAAS